MANSSTEETNGSLVIEYNTINEINSTVGDSNVSLMSSNVKDINHTMKVQNKTIQVIQPNSKKIENNLEPSVNYGVVFGIILLISLILVVVLKNRKKYTPILSEKKTQEHDEDYFKDCLKDKDWEGIQAIVDDPSFSEDIKKRARDVLENNGLK